MTRNEIKSLIERLHSVWSAGDVAAIPTVYASDFIAHTWFGALQGHDDVRDAIERSHHAVDGFTETIADMIIECDRVVTRYVLTGTHVRPFLDMPPTGPIRVTEISIFRVRDGLVAEQWCGRVADDTGSS